MTVERAVRIIAGTLVLVSLALGTWVNRNWYWFTAFVGANLFQSGITKWCLMEDILLKLGVGRKPDDSKPGTQHAQSEPLGGQAIELQFGKLGSSFKPGAAPDIYGREYLKEKRAHT